MVRQSSPEPAAEPAKRKRVALYAEITPEVRRQLRILAAEQDTRIEALVARPSTCSSKSTASCLSREHRLLLAGVLSPR